MTSIVVDRGTVGGGEARVQVVSIGGGQALALAVVNVDAAGEIIASPAGGDASAANQTTGNNTLADIRTALQIMDDWDEADRAKVNIIAGQVGITAGAGAVAANTPRVTHASDDPAVAALGVTTGAAVSTDANGTIQQYLRGLVVLIVNFLSRLPAALGANGGLKIEGVASGVAVPTTGPMTSAEFLANLRSTATHSSVSSGTSSVTILASNANRKGGRIFNTDANALYLDISGGTAVAASRAQYKLATETGMDIPAGCTGTITGIWAGDGAGVASVVELA